MSYTRRACTIRGWCLAVRAWWSCTARSQRPPTPRRHSEILNSGTSGGRRLATAAAVVLLAAVTAAVFSGVWRAGISHVVGRENRAPVRDTHATDWQTVRDADTILATWLVPRN